MVVLQELQDFLNLVSMGMIKTLLNIFNLVLLQYLHTVPVKMILQAEHLLLEIMTQLLAIRNQHRNMTTLQIEWEGAIMERVETITEIKTEVAIADINAEALQDQETDVVGAQEVDLEVLIDTEKAVVEADMAVVTKEEEIIRVEEEGAVEIMSLHQQHHKGDIERIHAGEGADPAAVENAP